MMPLPAPLVLASTSRYRIAQLQRLGMEFEAVAPPIEEETIVAETARGTIALRAAVKACAVQELPDYEHAFILAADQGVILVGDDGTEQLLGKPGDHPRAVAQLCALAGRSHTLYTAVALAVPGGALLEVQETVLVTMRAFAEDEAAQVVARDESWDCAGSYKIEGAGPWLMERVECSDPTAIEGLPLMAVGRLLRRAGGMR